MTGSLAKLHHRVAELRAIPVIEQRTPEWYEMRKGRITASEVAAILDIKPFASFSGSPRQEALYKKAFPNDPRWKFEGNVHTQHGVAHEDEACLIYEQELGKTVLAFGLLCHPTITWLGCSPDGICTDGTLIEIKCPLKRPIVPGEVPEHYLPQVQLSMEVLDLEICHFIQYKPRSITYPDPPVFDITPVQRDRQWFADALPKLESFRAELLAGVKLPAEKRKRADPKPKPAPAYEMTSDDEQWQ